MGIGDLDKNWRDLFSIKAFQINVCKIYAMNYSMLTLKPQALKLNPEHIIQYNCVTGKR